MSAWGEPRDHHDLMMIAHHVRSRNATSSEAERWEAMTPFEQRHYLAADDDRLRDLARAYRWRPNSQRYFLSHVGQWEPGEDRRYEGARVPRNQRTPNGTI